MRQPGYYWVKHNIHWSVAFYSEEYNGWLLFGDEYLYDDSEFNEIDETQITRS